MKKFFKQLFCFHNYKLTYVCYQERYKILECDKCKKEIYTDID